MRVLRRVRAAREVLRAVGPMALIEVRLRTADLPSICGRLGLRYDLDSAAPPPARLAVLPPDTRRAVRACLFVVAHWPAGDTCLRRCLLVGHRLRGLGPVLRIGVRRSPDGVFSAHSWLELGGGTLDPTASEYSVLGSAGR